MGRSTRLSDMTWFVRKFRKSRWVTEPGGEGILLGKPVDSCTWARISRYRGQILYCLLRGGFFRPGRAITIRFC